MKKSTLYKICLGLIIMVLPLTVKAAVSEFISVQDTVSKRVGNVEIKSLHFVDNSDQPSYNFGLLAEINNRTQKDVLLKIKIGYYNEKKVLIYSELAESVLNYEQTDTLIALSSAKLDSKYNVNDIAYYTVSFELKDVVNIEETKSAKDDETCLQNSYTIENYKVKIDAQKDNTYDIEETFTVHYNDSQNKKIERTIPLERNVTNRDGSKSAQKIKLLTLSFNRSLSRFFNPTKGNILRLDDSSATSMDIKHSLKYTYSSKNENKNEQFLYTIDPAEWGTCMSEISFEINMPSEFDPSKIQFVETNDQDKTADIKIDKGKNSIRGSYDGILKDDSLNMSIFLEDGYFTAPHPSLGCILIFVLPTFFVMLSFTLWFFFGRDRHLKEKIKKVPPKNKNVLEVLLATKKEVTQKDAVILLLKLCDDGYLRITKTKRGNKLHPAEYTITKIREYAGSILEEKLLMEDLFSTSLSKINDKMLEKNYDKGKASKKLSDLRGMTVETRYLKGNLFITSNSIINSADKNYYDKIFEKSATLMSKIVSYVGYIIGLIITVIPSLEYGRIEDGLIIGVLTFVIAIAVKEGLMNSNKASTKIGALILISISIILSRVTPLWETIIYERIYGFGMIFGVIMIFINKLFIEIMPKYTEYGSRLYEETKSYEHFLKSIKSQDFEELFKKSNEDTSKTLLYIYLFGLEKTTLKSLSSDIEMPSWLENTKPKELRFLKKDLENLVIKTDAM